MTRTDNKKTLVNIIFNLNPCKNLTKKELDVLSDIATKFFHFVQAFGNKLKPRDFVNIWMVQDRVQDLNSVTCGIFQIYFYNNLFNPNENSKIQDKKRLNKRTRETLLNELFLLMIRTQSKRKFNNTLTKIANIFSTVNYSKKERN